MAPLDTTSSDAGTSGSGGSGGSQSTVGPSGGSVAVSKAGAPSAGSPSVPAAGGAGGAAGTTNSGGGGASSAGTGGAGGSPAKPSICDGAATRVLAVTDSKVDDFEGATIAPGWSSFNDVLPVPNAFSIMQATSDGAATTVKAGRYQGTGAKTLPKGGYGVGTVYNIAINKAQGNYCIDISAFDGVSFWAKAAMAGASIEVNFVIPETNATKDGGDCLSGCYNHPRKAVTLTAAWQQYTVTFASAGMGAHAISNRLQELAWLAPLDTDWDFSVDEIAFYKGTAPTGPVGAAQ